MERLCALHLHAVSIIRQFDHADVGQIELEKVTHQGTQLIGQVKGRVGHVGWQEQLQHHTLPNPKW